MRALYDFIIKPLGETYDNKIKIDKKELILNTKIESFKFQYARMLLERPPNWT